MSASSLLAHSSSTFMCLTENESTSPLPDSKWPDLKRSRWDLTFPTSTNYDPRRRQPATHATLTTTQPPNAPNTTTV
eukprot:8746436-Pyramimonas_sp.AAC.1